MTLRWKEFERRAKKLARAEIRASPKLKAERKKLPGISRVSNSVFLLQFLLTMLSFAPLLTWMQVSVEAAFAALAISVTGAAFLNAGMWQNRLYNPPDIAAFIFLPVASENVFRIQSRRAFRMTPLLVVSFLILYAVAFANDGFPGFGNALIVAIGQTLLCVALVAHLLIYFPANLIPLTGMALTVGWVLVSVFLRWLKTGQEPTFWMPFARFLPASWLHELYFALAGHSSWTHMLFALPIAVLFALAPHSFARLRHSYVTALNDPNHAKPEEAPAAPTSSPTELADRADAGVALATPALEPRGFIDRLLLAPLSERERLLLIFFWRQPDWTRKWLWSAGLLAAVCAVGLILTKARTAPIALAAAGFIFGQGSLPLSSGGVGFRGWPCGGNLIAAQFAFLPIAYNEMFRIVLKINLIRLLFAAPLWILFSAALGAIFDQTATGAIIGLKFLIALAILQPFLFATSMTTAMNIKRKIWAIPFLLMFALLVLTGIAYAIGIPNRMFDFVKTPLVNAISVIAATILSILWNEYFRWLYRVQKIDAISHMKRG